MNFSYREHNENKDLVKTSCQKLPKRVLSDALLRIPVIINNEKLQYHFKNFRREFL